MQTFRNVFDLHIDSEPLYSRAGFIRKETYTPVTANWWFRNSIEVYRYEKEFQGGI
jgi:hypothetical protein